MSTDKTVLIYDRGNKDRLLGYLIHRPIARLQGKIIQLAIHRRLSLRDYVEDPVQSLHLDRVSLEIDYRPSPCGWELTPVLLTATPLSVLMQLDIFRLPEEDDQSARFRLGRR